MLTRVQGLVLGTVRHSDRFNITSLYTRSHGRISLLTPAGAGKSARMTASRLQPLALVEADVSFVSGRQIFSFRNLVLRSIRSSIYQDPVRMTQTFFLSEFLGRFLRDSNPEPELFDWIAAGVDLMDSLRKAEPNFHLAFLVELLRPAGIMPDISSYFPDYGFDMRNGGFFLFPHPGAVWIPAFQAEFIPLLSRMTLRNCSRFSLSGAARREILEMLLRYYAVHFPGVDNLKSPAVLSEIFSG